MESELTPTFDGLGISHHSILYNIGYSLLSLPFMPLKYVRFSDKIWQLFYFGLALKDNYAFMSADTPQDIGRI